MVDRCFSAAPVEEAQCRLLRPPLRESSSHLWAFSQKILWLCMPMEGLRKDRNDMHNPGSFFRNPIAAIPLP